MVSLLSSLNMTANTLGVNEKAISVVSHNVANMNTKGYSKQHVHFATRNIAGAIGDDVNNQIRANGGVKIANVMRYSDEYLNTYYRDQLSDQKKLEQQLGNLKDLADIFNDLDDSGIDAALRKFYEALNNLNEYPASSTARTNFIEVAKTLTATMNAKSKQLDEMTAKALGNGKDPASLETSKIYNEFEALNDKLQALADVNKALMVTQTGSLDANNLLDKRDLILNEIAEFVDITVEEKYNGAVNVYIGDAALVKGAVVTGKLDIQTAYEYCGGDDAAYADWINNGGEKAIIRIVGETSVANANDIIQGGIIGGLIHSGTANADGVENPGTIQSKLNDLAKELADIFNTLNTREGAYCINKNDTSKLQATTEDNVLFVSSVEGETEITAANISLRPDLLTDDGCWSIACAYFGNTPAADVDLNAVGNAQNAVDMLLTRGEKRENLKGMSIEDFYTNLLGKIASAGSNIQSQYDTQTNVVDAIKAQIDDYSGVNLNEELVDLVKYQTAYAAAAQVFNTCNTCLDTLMRLGG